MSESSTGAGPADHPAPLPTPPVPSGQPDQPPTGVPEPPNQEATELARALSENGRLRAQLKSIESELTTHRQASMSEQEKAVAAAKAAGAAEWESKWRAAKIENAALAVLGRHGVAATDLALRGLDLADVDVSADGRVDAKAIESAVTDLLKRYPMLSAAANSAPGLGPVSGGDQRRVSGPQVLKPADPNTDRNQVLRWALTGE